MANLTHAELITPERVLYSGDAEAVVMRTDGGDITFLANHMDFIGAVDICVVRIEGAQQAGDPAEGGALACDDGRGRGPRCRGAQVRGRQVRSAVHGGFVMVADNKVTIAAAVAELAEEIDVARAKRALEAAGGDRRRCTAPGRSTRGAEDAEARRSSGRPCRVGRGPGAGAPRGGRRAGG